MNILLLKISIIYFVLFILGSFFFVWNGKIPLFCSFANNLNYNLQISGIISSLTQTFNQVFFLNGEFLFCYSDAYNEKETDREYVFLGEEN